MSGSQKTHGSGRRADIDYLRVGVLMLLIVYHVLLVYDSWDWWRVKSGHAGFWADYLITTVTPWRMSLVFFVGGVAARFMFEQSKPLAFVRERATKLLTAFVFAVIVLIPLQRYVRLDENGGAAASYLDYVLHEARYVVPYQGIWLPDFANAWFLPYLFLYSVAIVAFWRLAPRTFAWLQRVVENTPIWVIAPLLMGWLAFHQAVLLAWQPETRVLLPDPSSHLRFVPLFLLGALVAKSDVFLRNLLGAKRVLWLVAAILLALSVSEQTKFVQAHPDLDGAATAFMAVHGLYGGAALLSVVAFAAWALNRPSRFLTYATDAILPIYLMHQTVLVVAADLIVSRHWPLALEMPALIALTLLIPLAIYHLAIRDVRWLRVLFGLRPKAREATKIERAESTHEPQPLSP